MYIHTYIFIWAQPLGDLRNCGATRVETGSRNAAFVQIFTTLTIYYVYIYIYIYIYTYVYIHTLLGVLVICSNPSSWWAGRPDWLPVGTTAVHILRFANENTNNYIFCEICRC